MLDVDTTRGDLIAFGERSRCAIGRGGAIPAAEKREGDGATPLGTWRLTGLLLRPDRVAPPSTALPWRWLRPTDGWSDDVQDPAYNRPVQHPHRWSAEHLWRDDHAYDVIVLLDHNSTPPVPGAGSAIFWHVAQPDFRPTEGCIASPRDVLVALLPKLAPGMVLSIRESAPQT